MLFYLNIRSFHRKCHHIHIHLQLRNYKRLRFH
jgi:hypothetical protein